MKGTIGFIGAGNMGEALIKGLIEHEVSAPDRVKAFDVVGERRQMNFRVDTSRRQMTEEIEVKLRNHKKEPVTVIVKENLYRWINWEIVEKTHAFEKQDSRTVHFPVQVAAGGETVLRYTVHYSW